MLEIEQFLHTSVVNTAITKLRVQEHFSAFINRESFKTCIKFT